MSKKAENMNRGVMLIVLTENTWLYAGLAALLPEARGLRMDFNTAQLPRGVQDTDRVIIAVDCLISFWGKWVAFNSLQTQRPDASVIWLAREETGRAFPVKSRREHILRQKQDIVTLRDALLRVYLGIPNRDNDYVSQIRLTHAEHYLLPYFMSDMSMPVISEMTGSSVKTLYRRRRIIALKAGFRQVAFMKFVYKQNQGLPGIHARNDPFPILMPG